jgi:hypothetical protein
VRKVANTFKQDDVTLKRGLIGSTDLFQWVKEVREGADGRRTVTITVLDEARNPVPDLQAGQRPAQEVGRPHPGSQGRRRGGDGRAAPDARGHHL